MELRRAKHSLSVISDQKDTSLLCCRTDSTALLATGEPEHQNNFYTVWTSLGGAAGDPCLLRPVPAAHTPLLFKARVKANKSTLATSGEHSPVWLCRGEVFTEPVPALCLSPPGRDLWLCVAWRSCRRAVYGLTKLMSKAQSSRSRSCTSCVCGQDLHSFWERQRRRADCLMSSLDCICKRK